MYEEIFEHLSKAHGLILVESEMNDIFKIIKKSKQDYYLNKARLILEPIASQYKEKNEANYICYADIDGDISEFEPLASEYYCEDCIEKAIKEAKENKELELPKDFKNFTYLTETSKEAEDFCLCSSCDEHIRQSIIWTRQEVEHWLSASKKKSNFKHNLQQPIICFELSRILCEHYGAVDKYRNKCAKIAKRIVKIKNQ